MNLMAPVAELGLVGLGLWAELCAVRVGVLEFGVQRRLPGQPGASTSSACV